MIHFQWCLASLVSKQKTEVMPLLLEWRTENWCLYGVYSQQVFILKHQKKSTDFIFLASLAHWHCLKLLLMERVNFLIGTVLTIWRVAVAEFITSCCTDMTHIWHVGSSGEKLSFNSLYLTSGNKSLTTFQSSTAAAIAQQPWGLPKVKNK